MIEPIDFPRAFRFGTVDVSGWTQTLAVSRERDDDGSEFCICWVGLVDLVENDGGGWVPEEGAALGYTPHGSQVVAIEWRDLIGDAAIEGQRKRPGHSLESTARYGQRVAVWATTCLPLVDAAFDRGATFEQMIVLAGEQVDAMLIAMYPDDEVTREADVHWLFVALGLLWVEEDIRREQASAV